MPLSPEQEAAMYKQQAAGTGSYFRDATPDMSDSERAQWTNQYGGGGTSYDPARQMEAYRAMQPGYTGTQPTYTGNTGSSTGAFMGGINNGNFATASVESPQAQIARYMAANGGGNPNGGGRKGPYSDGNMGRYDGSVDGMHTGASQYNQWANGRGVGNPNAVRQNGYGYPQRDMRAQTGGFRGFNPNSFRKPGYDQGNYGSNGYGGGGRHYGGFRPPTSDYNMSNGGGRMYTGGSRNFNENPNQTYGPGRGRINYGPSYGAPGSWSNPIPR